MLGLSLKRSTFLYIAISTPTFCPSHPHFYAKYILTHFILFLNQFITLFSLSLLSRPCTYTICEEFEGAWEQRSIKYFTIHNTFLHHMSTKNLKTQTLIYLTFSPFIIIVSLNHSYVNIILPTISLSLYSCRLNIHRCCLYLLMFNLLFSSSISITIDSRNVWATTS